MMKENQALDAIARSVRDLVMEQRKMNYMLENLFNFKSQQAIKDLKANFDKVEADAKIPSPIALNSLLNERRC